MRNNKYNPTKIHTDRDRPAGLVMMLEKKTHGSSRVGSVQQVLRIPPVGLFSNIHGTGLVTMNPPDPQAHKKESDPSKAVQTASTVVGTGK